MRSPDVRTSSRLAALVAILALSAPAEGQLPTASAADLGLGGNYTALARGFGAIGANPAGLGMPDNPRFTLSLLPVLVQTGMDPVSLSDFNDFEDRVVPADVKERWLELVEDEGSEAGVAGAEVTFLAATLGQVGFQVTTEAFGRLSLSPDAMELVLFGNAGRTGEPADLTLQGSSADGFAVTTAGLGFGMPLGDQSARTLAVGATLKYSVGHGIGLARDNGSASRGDPLEIDLRFPLLHTRDEGREFDNGNGFGLDVGGMWQRERLTLGLVVKNVFNTFEWDLEDMVFRPGTALFNDAETASDFDARPGAEAPPVLLDALEEQTFDPVVSAGLAYEAGRRTTVTMDVRNRFGEGLRSGPDFHAGVGLEYVPVGSSLLLRAGGAVVTDGFQLGGGASAAVGSVHLSGAILKRTGHLDDSTVGTLVLSFEGH